MHNMHFRKSVTLRGGIYVRRRFRMFLLSRLCDPSAPIAAAPRRKLPNTRLRQSEALNTCLFSQREEKSEDGRYGGCSGSERGRCDGAGAGEQVAAGEEPGARGQAGEEDGAAG